MLTLSSKLKREDVRAGRAPGGSSDSTHRVSVRDRLLIKGTAPPFSLVNFILLRDKGALSLWSFALSWGLSEQFVCKVVKTNFVDVGYAW